MSEEKIINSNNDETARTNLEEARNTPNRIQQYGLLISALEIAVDEILKSEIQKEFDVLSVSIKSSLKIQVELLKTKTDEGYEDFISALRSLEEWDKAGYPFLNSEVAQIESARKWFDEKRKKEGAGVSKALIGGLKDRYVLFKAIFEVEDSKREDYYINVDKKLSYEEYLGLLDQKWKEESKNICGKVLINSGQTARTSPSAARTFLQDVLVKETDYVHEDRTLKIKEYPFDNPEIEKIKLYIGSLEKLCENESNADNLKTRAINATNAYAKYELLINAREYGWQIPAVGDFVDKDVHYLLGLDKAIVNAYDDAVEFRCDKIKASLDTISEVVQAIPSLSKGIIEDQLNKTEERINAIQSDTISWPGKGLVLRLDSGENYVKRKIVRPNQLELEEQRCKEVQIEFSQLKSAYEYFLKDEEKRIRELLDAPDLNKKQEGIQAFNNLKQHEKYSIISKFQIFNALESYKIQQTDFEDGGKSIQDHFNKGNWSQILELCTEFESKPNYKTKCPREIKQNISLWKKTADHKLKLQKLQDLVENENYLGAKRFWERSQREKEIDWEPISFYIEKIKQVEDNGKQLWEFYQKSLIEFGLYPHILLDILQDPDGIFDRIDSLKAGDAKIAREIIGESKEQLLGEHFDGNVTRYLSGFLKKVSFEQKITLLEKVNHAAGKSPNKDTSWPASTTSLAQYEARLLSRFLISLIRQEALIYLDNNKNSEKELDLASVGIRINSIYKFKFPLSEEERSTLKNIEIEYAQTRSLQSSPDQALQIWETVKGHFEEDISVSAEFSRAKRNWYLSEVQKLRAKGQLIEALELISKGFDDENVGTIAELYLEKAYTCLATEDFSEARRAVEEVRRKHKKKNEILLKLEIDIDLGEKNRLYRDEPLVFMNSLLEYWNIVDKKYKGIVEQSLNKNYNSLSKQYKDELNEKIKDDRDHAWHPLLDLIKLEDIYRKVKPQARLISIDFVEQLVPTFYPTGINLIEDSESFNEIIMDHGVELKRCLSEGEKIFGRLDSYKELLFSLLEKDDGYAPLPLEEVIRHIINKKVRDQRKKEFLSELNEYKEDIEGKPRKYSEIQKNRSRVNKNLERLKQLEKKLIEATNAELWLQTAFSAQLDLQNTDPWSPLDTFGEKLREYRNFEEVITFQSALGEWKNTFASIHKEIESLNDSFSEEKYEEAQKSAQTLENLYQNLPAFSRAPQQLTEVLNKLMGAVEVNNSKTKDTIIGLGVIRDSITELLEEIDSWRREKEEVQNEVDVYNQKIMDIKNKVDRFKKHDYGAHNKTLKNANKYLIEEYFEKINIKTLSTQQKTYSSLPKPDYIPVDNPSSAPAQENVNPSEGLLSSLTKLISVNKSSAENRLLKAINSSKEISYSVSAQKVDIDKLISEIESSKNNNQVSLAVNSHTAEDIKKEYGLLIKHKQEWIKDLEEASKIIVECQKKTPYPKKEELQGYYARNQYNNMALRIIEADLIGSVNQSERDEVNAFREILIKVHWV